LLVAEALPPLLPGLGTARDFGGTDEMRLRDRIFFTPFDELLLAVVARDLGEIPIFADRPGAGQTRDHWSVLEQEIRNNNALDLAQLEAAIARSETASPGDLRNIASQADYLSRLGRTAEAAAAGQRVLAGKPTYFEGYRFMADAAKERGDFAQARELYLQALGIYRLIPDARKNLGDLDRRAGDLTAAQAAYAEAFALDAANVGAAIALAEIQANTDDRESARATLEAAAVHSPRDEFVFQALGRLHAAEGRPNEAMDAFARALEIDPSMSPRELLRVACESRGPKEQKDLFGAYEARFGDEHDLYNNYAWLLATAPNAEVRDPAVAVRLARRAIELSPAPNAYYHGTLAAASAAAGDFDAARSNLRSALRLAAGNDGLRTELFAMRECFEAGQPYIERLPSP